MPRRQAPALPAGRGNATITADGCSVEIYAALSAGVEPQIVHAAVAALLTSSLINTTA